MSWFVYRNRFICVGLLQSVLLMCDMFRQRIDRVGYGPFNVTFTVDQIDKIVRGVMLNLNVKLDINSSHSTIKFTQDHSHFNLSFLDVTVSLDSNNKISTDLLVKSTDTHQYLGFASWHPNHVKKFIHLSLASCIHAFAPPLRNFIREPKNDSTSYKK